jgi:RimJ/RimL family protein N-acetyltransferase
MGGLTRQTIAGARLTLVPATDEHVIALEAGVAPPDLVLADGFPHEDTLAGLRMGGGWLIVADGRVIGDCGMHSAEGPSSDVEIGYGLAAPQRGRGYGTEAVRLLSDWLLDQPSVRAIVAEVDPDNVPSRRVLEKAGFVQESVSPDGVLLRRTR